MRMGNDPRMRLKRAAPGTFILKSRLVSKSTEVVSGRPNIVNFRDKMTHRPNYELVSSMAASTPFGHGDGQRRQYSWRRVSHLRHSALRPSDAVESDASEMTLVGQCGREYVRHAVRSLVHLTKSGLQGMYL